MALTESGANKMLEILTDDLDRIYLLKSSSTLDDNISSHTSRITGYTNDNGTYVEMGWATPSSATVESTNAPNATPIMFAVPKAAVLYEYVFTDSTGVIRAKYGTIGTYLKNGTFYIDKFSFTIGE